MVDNQYIEACLKYQFNSNQINDNSMYCLDEFELFENCDKLSDEESDKIITKNIDIKWDLWNQHFIDYYREVIINIDNR